MAERRQIAGFRGAGPSPGMQEYRKTKTALAEQLDHPFEVHTEEGVMTGEPGDYLMCGVEGERYVCARDIFESSYEPVDAPFVEPGEGGAKLSLEVPVRVSAHEWERIQADLAAARADLAEARTTIAELDELLAHLDMHPRIDLMPHFTEEQEPAALAAITRHRVRQGGGSRTSETIDLDQLAKDWGPAGEHLARSIELTLEKLRAAEERAEALRAALDAIWQLSSGDVRKRASAALAADDERRGKA